MTSDPPLLQIDPDGCTLTDGRQPPVVLQVSPRTIAARHWPRGQPGALQLERAIDDVENAIEQAGLVHGDRGMLRVSAELGALLHPALLSAGLVPRDGVEAAFSRLVFASGAADPQHAAVGESAAALLLVRELMHHLGFQSLQTGG